MESNVRMTEFDRSTLLIEDTEFTAWVHAQPEAWWAKSDLSACRLGWAAGRATIARVYEIAVDHGDCYHSVALLPNLREAVRFARETEPRLLDEYAEEHVCVEIRERPIGRANSDGCYNIVATVTHELCDDDEWEVTTSYRSRWFPHAWVHEDGSEPSERRWNGTGYEEGGIALRFEEELV
jgi:hypothetical protein